MSEHRPVALVTGGTAGAGLEASVVLLTTDAAPLSRFLSDRPPGVADVAGVAASLACGAAEVAGQTVSVNGGLSFGGW